MFIVVVAAGLAGASPWVLADTNARRTPQTGRTWAQSIEVVDDGAPLMVAADPASRRRGTAGVGTRLPVLRRVTAPGCANDAWYETPDHLFVCAQHVRPTQEAPGATPSALAGASDQPQRRHAFVQVDGTRAYAHPSDYFADEYVEAMGEGFGIVITDEQRYNGVDFVRTRRHLWIERASVRFSKGSDFSGIRVPPGGTLDFAWVSPKPAPLYKLSLIHI